jgi:RNA polymerase subunit RPABC4/transcription elongation factor Spt4
MSAHTTLDQTYLPLIKQHARDRWHERTPGNQPLASAWFSATPVDAPAAKCSHARLYEPTDALMLVRDGWLRTVLINDGRLQHSGLVMCDNCDDLVDPITHTRCPTCGSPQPAVQTCGQVTVVHGGENR